MNIKFNLLLRNEYHKLKDKFDNNILNKLYYGDIDINNFKNIIEKININ